jgi:hypothetical protein
VLDQQIRLARIDRHVRNRNLGLHRGRKNKKQNEQKKKADFLLCIANAKGKPHSKGSRKRERLLLKPSRKKMREVKNVTRSPPLARARSILGWSQNRKHALRTPRKFLRSPISSEAPDFRVVSQFDGLEFDSGRLVIGRNAGFSKMKHSGTITVILTCAIHLRYGDRLLAGISPTDKRQCWSAWPSGGLPFLKFWHWSPRTHESIFLDMSPVKRGSLCWTSCFCGLAALQDFKLKYYRPRFPLTRRVLARLQCWRFLK